MVAAVSGRITAFEVCLDCWPVLPFALFVLLCFIHNCWSQRVPAVLQGIQTIQKTQG